MIIKIDCKSFFPSHGQTISSENSYIVEWMRSKVLVFYTCCVLYNIDTISNEYNVYTYMYPYVSVCNE